MLGYQITHCLLSIQRRAKASFKLLGLFDSSVDFETLETTIGTENSDWCAVLNVDSTHWLLLYYDASRKLIVFADSLGRDLAQYNFSLSSDLQTLVGSGRLIHLPGYQVQEKEARTCGLFVVYWAAQLSGGTSLARIFSAFPPNQQSDNDLRVTQWFREHFPELFSCSWT